MSNCGWFPMSYEQILAWVERHRADLPTNLEELSRLPMRFRTVIVNNVDPAQRTRFWTEHLQSFVGPASQLNAEQQEFVVSSISELPQILGSGPAPNPVVIEWESRLSRVFSRQEAGKIFAMVGPPEPPEGLPLPPDAFPG